MKLHPHAPYPTRLWLAWLIVGLLALGVLGALVALFLIATEGLG